MELQKLISIMKSPSPDDITLIGKALLFAKEAHKDHKRYSGEPYFTHLLETAKILAELGSDSATIAAGLLHDSIEDVGVAPETIRKEFGEDVLSLVEGVTKIGHIRYSGTTRYSESMRQMLIASSKDIRVLIIKLCDRLHNMRTLKFVPMEKQRRIALETLEIYAPIGYRLGIRKITRELQDLSFSFAYPEECKRVEQLLSERETEYKKELEKFRKGVLKALGRQGVRTVSSEGRIKGMYSLYLKLETRNWNIEKVFDVLAVRVIVRNLEDCYRALGAIHAAWRPLPRRIKDYIAFPKPNGYRSLHTTVLTGDGGTVEIQIRTEEMHRVSEYGAAVHAVYKEQEQFPTQKRKVRPHESIAPESRKYGAIQKTAVAADVDGKILMPPWVRELGILDAAVGEQEFWEHLREDFFKNRIFIFTPKGDVVDLPTDSTPLDFAYAIHSDIGDRTVGAKVNGKLVPISTNLSNGDVVEILTKKSAKPTARWLDIAKTSVAKKHIRMTLTKLGVKF